MLPCPSGLQVWKLRYAKFRDGVQGIDNPLRDLPQLQKAMQQAESIRQELLTVRKAIDDLPIAVQQDLARLDQATAE